MGFIHALERWIARANRALLVFVVLSLSVLRSGVWTIPNISSLNTLALNPFVNPYQGDSQYLYSNWLGPFLAWCLGALDQWQFTLLHLGFSITFLLITIIFLHVELPSEQWRKAVCIFAMLPVSWTHLYWIGYDSLVLTLMASALVLIHRPLFALVLGIGLGLQHFEVGFLAFLSLVLVIVATFGRSSFERQDARGAIAVVAGTLIGKSCLKLIMVANNIVVTSDRSDYLVNKLHDAVLVAFLSGPMVLISFLGVGWIFVLHYQSSGRCRLGLALALLLATVVSIITLDNTRVFAVISFPAIAYCLLRSREWLEKVPLSFVTTLFLAWLATPAVFSWGGKPQISVLPYDLVIISHNLFHWPQIPARQIRPLWPFSH